MDPLTTLRRAGDPDGARTGAPARTRPDWAELVFRLVAFAVLCVFALSVAPRLIEPDDYAYQGSIIALSHGHLTLSNSQYHAVLTQMEHLDGSKVLPSPSGTRRRTAAGSARRTPATPSSLSFSTSWGSSA